ncbi:MAG: hypothetical protein ACF8XB_09675 [Planctomycetota bacterium JB042]
MPQPTPSTALRLTLALALAAAPPAAGAPEVRTAASPFPNFESGPVNALLLSPDGRRLYALNTPDHRVEVFATAGVEVAKAPSGGPAAPTPVSRPVRIGAVFCGLEPVAMALHPDDPDVLFVSNHVSDSVSVVDLAKLQVVQTIPVGDEPQGLVVADGRLFVACARAPQVPPAPGQLDPGPFDEHVVVVTQAAPPYAWIANVPVDGVKPRDVCVAAGRVHAVPQVSGNRTTLLDETETKNAGLEQETPDAFDPPFEVNPVLLRPELNLARGWYVPNAGRIVFASEYPAQTPQPPDRDVVPIDPATLATGAPTTDVGTTLFDVERNPSTGHLWITNTDARNRTRFEPTLRGAAIENRITIADPALGGVLRVVELAPPATSRPFAQPAAIAFLDRPAAPRAYVAALGSAAVAVLDARTAAHVDTIETGPIPHGVAVDADRGVVWVSCRGDATVRGYDLSNGHAPLAVVRLGYDPEPRAVRDGRLHLYEARPETGASNGTMSCASCHVFGHHDGLAWDLGDPGGSLSYYYPDTLDDILSYPGQNVVFPTTPILNPLKGPMVTQSLRGLMDPDTKDDLPLHWRGERRTFHTFRSAFEGLLGGRGVERRTMQEFATFVRSIRYAPNPFQPKDRQYQGAAASGMDTFGMNPAFHGKPYGSTTSDVGCIDCHQGDFFAQDDFTGGRPVASAGSFTQLFQTAQLRMSYEKRDRDLTGFGLLHDGAVDGVRGFMDFTIPNGGPPTFSNFTTQDKDEVATFVDHWDHGLSPLVGAQFTLSPTALGPAATAFLDLAEAQARPPHRNVDLIVKGFRIDPALGLLPRGAVYEPDDTGTWRYRFDTGDAVDRTVLALVVQAGVATFTFTCVPPGTGRRLGVDRDEDGVFDFLESKRGLDAAAADSDGDGFDDGLEIALGTDPRRPDASIPDATPPTIDGDRALEVFHSTATLSFATDEPAAVKVELGSAVGLSDLGVVRDGRLHRRRDLPLDGLPADTTVHYRITATDRSGNAAVRDGSFLTLPPFLHVDDLTLEVNGAGPYTVTARVRVVDHEETPVVGVPVMGFFAGDLGGAHWQREGTTDATGWATITVPPYTPAAPTEVAFTPAFVGSADSKHAWFVGVGGERPTFFYDQTENRRHHAVVPVP